MEKEKLEEKRRCSYGRMGFVKTVAMIFILVYTTSCKKDPESKTVSPVTTIDCGNAPKSFATDVMPVVLANCNGCHGIGSSNGPGALTTYAQIFSARVSIRSAVSSGSMPRNGSLTASQKSAIICWIDNGAPNN